MKIREITEGAMKRSHPLISGDLEMRSEPAPTKPRTMSTFAKTVKTLADRAGVPESKVRELYARAKESADPRLADKYLYMSVWAKVKRDLGVQ